MQPKVGCTQLEVLHKAVNNRILFQVVMRNVEYQDEDDTSETT